MRDTDQSSWIFKQLCLSHLIQATRQLLGGRAVRSTVRSLKIATCIAHEEKEKVKEFEQGNMRSDGQSDSIATRPRKRVITHL